MKKNDIMKIMKDGIILNGQEGITAHVLFHGNTGCLCVIVGEAGREVYENKAFITNGKGIRAIRKDMRTMIRQARRERR
jgi:dihydrodipicolinate synthase/N-acetylneuraminate lyase